MTVNIPEELQLIEFDELARDDNKHHIFCGVCYPVSAYPVGSYVICMCGVLTDVTESTNLSDVDCDVCKETKQCSTCGGFLFF